MPPKAGSNSDYAIVRLVAPVPGAEPFPVEDRIPVVAGEALIEAQHGEISVESAPGEGSTFSFTLPTAS